jgi:PPOX class probable F420-dependent enzyme
MERDETLARLRDARIGHLATVTPEGRPHVVPFVFALVEANDRSIVYWAVDRKPKRTGRLRRLENLRANPAVELVVDGYEEDWTLLWWVRAGGTARIVEDEAERTAALAALAEKYEPYRAEPPLGPVVAIDVLTITGWTGGTRERLGPRRH